MKRSLLLSTALVGVVLGQAFADELDITKSNNNPPFSTATAVGGGPGDIVVTPSTNVQLKNPGSVITINSNNLVINQGIIQQTSENGAIGVHILGGNTGAFTNDGTNVAVINVTGGGTGNYGVLLDGSAPFTGELNFGVGSSLNSHGQDSTGIAILAPLVGNLTMGSTLIGTDKGSTGILVTAPITGMVNVTGNVRTEAYANTNLYSSKVVDPLTGAGIAIGNNITGGVVISGPATTDQNSSVVASNVLNTSTLPAVVIAPSVSSTPGNIVIGNSSADPTNPTFSFINRGIINDQENDPGVTTTGMRIGESGSASYTVTLPGGFYNRGTIQSSSESDNKFATKVAATPTDAYGLVIGNGAILKGFAYQGLVSDSITTDTIALDSNASSVNGYYDGLVVTWNGQERLITAYDGASKIATIGSLYGSSETWVGSAPIAGTPFSINSAPFKNDGQIIASMGGNQPGTVTGMLIQPGGNLPFVENTGTIQATVSTTDTTISSLTAVGLRDQSGTLTQLLNAGRILTTVTPLDNGQQQAIAVDLSTGTQDQRITDFGLIIGDVYFGHGNNQLDIEGSQSLVSGVVHAAPGGTLNVVVSQGGSGATLLTSDLQADSLTVGNKGAVNAQLSKNTGTTPVIHITGAATLGDGAVVGVLASTFLPDGTYTLIRSDSGQLTVANPTTATASIKVPYIYDSTITTTNNDLKLTLVRKSASELGLTGNAAAVYEPLAQAALSDDLYGAQLLTVTNATDMQTAVKSLVPDIAGGVRTLAISMTDEATGVIGTRQRNLLTTPATTEEFHFWSQEFYNNVHDDGSGEQQGFNGAGQGIALGAEWGAERTGRYGIGYTFFSSQEVEEHPRDTKTDGDWNMISAYAGWRFANTFFLPQITGGFGNMNTRRGIVTGTPLYTATAQWTSYIASAGATSGVVFNLGSFQIIPTFALDEMYLREGAYNEVGAGGVGLSLKDQTQKSVRSFAGVIAQTSVNYDQGAFTEQVIGGWSHEFIKSPATIDGSFEAAPGSPFHLTGPQLDPDRIVGGMSFAYVLRNWSAGFNYDASANAGSLSQSATISLSSRF